jgi:hypothetical protein
MNKKLSSACFGGLVALSLTGRAFGADFINGDFESGNMGFTSGYQYVPPDQNALWPEGLYTVENNPNDSHNLAYTMGDHTSGKGNMMMLNGAPDPGVLAWEGQLDGSLTPGDCYKMSVWVASWSWDEPAALRAQMSGQDIGTFSPSLDGNWLEWKMNFTATEATPTFRIFDDNIVRGGNDFALDDIHLAAANCGVPDGGAGLAGILAIVGVCAAGRGRK